MSELIFPPGAPHPQCHAATVAMTPAGLTAAWFGGSYEKHPDVGIWISRLRDGRWSVPEEIAVGHDLAGQRVPCWNPVLCQPSSGPLLLFYKVGATIPGWSSMLRTSPDNGVTWSGPRQLPSAACGPVKNKPLELSDGSLLCGSSLEPTWQNWQVYLSRTPDHGDTRKVTGPHTHPATFQAIQPSLFDPSGLHPRLATRTGNDPVLALCRTRQGVVGRMHSPDGGTTWSGMDRTSVPNPDSGLDGTTLSDGRLALVCNDIAKGRSRLSILVSEDGERFDRARTLVEGEGEYSYPSVIRVGKHLHIVYTHQRTAIAYEAVHEAEL